jgi:MFS family permease
MALQGEGGYVPQRSAFAALRNSQFRWLYGSNIAFFFAMNGQFVVRSYLAFDMTDSPAALGIINLAVAIPLLVISPFGGVVADRVERRKLIMAGQAVLILNEAVVLSLLAAGLLAFWHLLAVVFVMGCVFPFIMPARQAVVVNIIGRQGLTNAMALQMGGMNAARVVAPALAGFLIYLVDIKATYAFAIAVYFVALAAMARVHRCPPALRTVRKTMYADIWEGMRYTWTDRPVRVLMVLGIVPILLAMPFQALLVVFAEDVWDMGSRGLGLLQAAAGLGGMAGAFYVAWFGETPRKLRLMIVSLAGFCLSLLTFSISPWFVLGLVFVFVADVFASVFQTVNNTIIQLLIPDEVRGRVMSLMMMTFGLTPLGTVPVSAVAEAFGAPAAVATASIVTMGICLLFMVFSGSLRHIDATSKQAMALPHPFPGAMAAESEELVTA